MGVGRWGLPRGQGGMLGAMVEVGTPLPGEGGALPRSQGRKNRAGTGSRLSSPCQNSVHSRPSLAISTPGML